MGVEATTEEVRALVDRFDQRGDGRISYPEFVDMAERFQEEGDRVGPKRDSKKGARGGQRTVVDRMEDAMGEIIRRVAAMGVDAITRLFDKFDIDGTGSISRAEFKKALVRSGLRVTDEETRLLIDRFDADGNGRIEYREFVDMAFPSAEREEGGRRGERGRGKRGGGHDESVVDDLESLLTRMVRDAQAIFSQEGGIVERD